MCQAVSSSSLSDSSLFSSSSLSSWHPDRSPGADSPCPPSSRHPHLHHRHHPSDPHTRPHQACKDRLQHRSGVRVDGFQHHQVGILLALVVLPSCMNPLKALDDFLESSRSNAPEMNPNEVMLLGNRLLTTSDLPVLWPRSIYSFTTTFHHASFSSCRIRLYLDHG